MPEQHPFRQFLLLAFALLLPCFAVWSAASAWLAIPAIGFTNMILTGWLPDFVAGVYVQGSKALLVTQFGELDGRLVPANQAGDTIAYLLDHRILSYSMPFYTALHFATPGEKRPGSFFVGLVVLYALLVTGMVSLSLKDMMVNLGTQFLQHPTAAVPPANLIALVYQFNVLILPTLAPVLLWAWQSRSTPLLQQMIEPLTRKGTP
jgi:hypothetical protein